MIGKALAVHDFLEVQEDIAAGLQKVGFRVLTTTDPLAAVDLINRYGPDLLVTRVDFGSNRLHGGILTRIARLRRSQTAVVTVVHDQSEEIAACSGEIIRAPFSRADIAFAALRAMAQPRKAEPGPPEQDRRRSGCHLASV